MAEFEITSATGQPYFAFLFRINFYTYLFLAIFVAFLENLMSQHLFAESALFCSEYASAKSVVKILHANYCTSLEIAYYWNLLSQHIFAARVLAPNQ